MAQFAFGPIYCETPTSALAVSFPIEPANTISNGVIVMFGLLSLYFVSKRLPRAYDLYFLAGVLVVQGIGSGLWHGLRDGYALGFEVMLGLLVLFGIAFCWSRRLWSYLGAAVFLAAFYGGFLLSRPYWGLVQRWVALAPVVILAGSILAGQTAMRSRKAALLGVAGMASSLTALGFRTYDLDVCQYFPMGTHFLWHMFNSGGAFLVILAMITLETEGALKRQRGAIEEPAQ